MTPCLLSVVLALGGFVSAPTAGPLRACPENPRCFADATGEAVLLVGSHTWSNLKDGSYAGDLTPFDYQSYLDELERLGHNFIRLWTWELARYSYDEGEVLESAPFPWLRTGPDDALDGKPKFDLDRFDDAYFRRLRERVEMARDRGVWVSIMLFEGHGVQRSRPPWCWDGHPFNRANNVNGIDGNPDGDERGTEIHQLAVPEILAIQEAYVRKVIDTVNDLDNVLYEIVNEAGPYSTEWQYRMIDLIHEYERAKPLQHPVGMTFQYAGGGNSTLFESPADWVSPNPEGGYRDDPPAATGEKVILTDTDHLWGIGGNHVWVWKSVTRGLNPLFMDPWDAANMPPPMDPKWDPIRRNLGHARAMTSRMDLRRAVPRGDLSSTGYCLADPGRAYLVYLPDGGEAVVDLSDIGGEASVEWLDPRTGERTRTTLPAGAATRLVAPFEGDAAALVLRANPNAV